MKNEYKITKQEMMSWAKEYSLHGKRNIVSFILFLILGIDGLFLIILNSLTKDASLLDWYLAAIFLIVSVYKLFFERFVVMSRRYKIYSTTYGVSEWIRSAEFTDDEIILTDHTSVSKFKYQNIKRINTKGNVVMIFFNDNIGLRIYKDSFVEGSWEEFKEKISSKIL
ncbi:MAG: hypothetical protein J6Q82_03165 [Clostridia bacterium]|nr:hypothetical protein [Clostridia bacterium]